MSLKLKDVMMLSSHNTILPNRQFSFFSQEMDKKRMFGEFIKRLPNKCGFIEIDIINMLYNPSEIYVDHCLCMRKIPLKYVLNQIKKYYDNGKLHYPLIIEFDIKNFFTDKSAFAKNLWKTISKFCGTHNSTQIIKKSKFPECIILCGSQEYNYDNHKFHLTNNKKMDITKMYPSHLSKDVNYNILKAIHHKINIPALNYQHYDESIAMSEALFHRKPYLRLTTLSKPQHINKHLSILSKMDDLEVLCYGINDIENNNGQVHKGRIFDLHKFGKMFPMICFRYKAKYVGALNLENTHGKKSILLGKKGYGTRDTDKIKIYIFIKSHNHTN
jgi:hypothetical protein